MPASNFALSYMSTDVSLLVENRTRPVWNTLKSKSKATIQNVFPQSHGSSSTDAYDSKAQAGVVAWVNGLASESLGSEQLETRIKHNRRITANIH